MWTPTCPVFWTKVLSVLILTPFAVHDLQHLKFLGMLDAWNYLLALVLSTDPYSTTGSHSDVGFGERNHSAKWETSYPMHLELCQMLKPVEPPNKASISKAGRGKGKQWPLTWKGGLRFGNFKVIESLQMVGIQKHANRLFPSMIDVNCSMHFVKY